jgi:hypothetical protein
LAFKSGGCPPSLASQAALSSTAIAIDVSATWLGRVNSSSSIAVSRALTL